MPLMGSGTRAELNWGLPSAPEDSLGEAVFVGYFEDGSEDWHDQRANGVGGSDVSSILQIHGSFKSRYLLWLEKTGALPREDEPDNPYLEWGHRLEPLIAEKFQEMHPKIKVVTKAGSWRHKDREWHLANPDGLLVNEHGDVFALLEIKCSATGYGWENGRVPAKYIAQVRWYLRAFGLSFAYIVVLESGVHYREYIIPADPSSPVIRADKDDEPSYVVEVGGDAMVCEVEAFVASMAENTPPPLDGGEDTFKYVKSAHPDITPKLEVEIGDLGMELQNAKNSVELWETELRRLKGIVIEAMDKAQYATSNGIKVARRRNGKGGVNLVILNV